jgi:hypothetical protein
MEKDDLKRLAKDASKKIVNTDFKNKRVVGDPSKISDKHAKSVKKYVHETFEKAVKKKAEHDKKKAERKAGGEGSNTPLASPPAADGGVKDEDEPVLKRMREEDNLNLAADDAVLKKLRTDEGDAPAPPPPPPPPAEPEPESMDTDPSPSENQDAFVSNTTPGAQQSANDNPGLSLGDASSSRPDSSHKNHTLSTPLQTATPPTTGSPDMEDPEKVARRQAYSGMSADRMRQLGLFDGATE